MGTLQYKVMYRYIHPITKQPIQNAHRNCYESYGVIVQDVKANGSGDPIKKEVYSFNFGSGSSRKGDDRDATLKPQVLSMMPTTNIEFEKQIELKFIEQRNNYSNKMYDALYCFDATKQVYAFNKVYPTHKCGTSGAQTLYSEANFEVYADTFKQVVGEPWFVRSVHSSFNSALEAARNLANDVGLSNVDVLKKVPLTMQVIIE